MEITTTNILKSLDINRNTFQDWLDRGLITPSVQKSTKQGESNLFSEDDFFCIAIFRALVSDSGFSRKKASMLVSALQAKTQQHKKHLQPDFGIAAVSFVIFRRWEAFIDVTFSAVRDPAELSKGTYLSKILLPAAFGPESAKTEAPDEVVILNIAKTVDNAIKKAGELFP